MRTAYEVRCGRRPVGTEVAESAREALVTFLIQYGTRNSEIVYLGVDKAAWRGAIYSATKFSAAAELDSGGVR